MTTFGCTTSRPIRPSVASCRWSTTPSRSPGAPSSRRDSYSASMASCSADGMRSTRRGSWPFPQKKCSRPFSSAHPGDLIFSHHPIDMRCGDPRGEPGEGFIPIRAETVQRLLRQELSFYACHVPLDIHPELSTSDAIVHVIGGRVVDHFLPYGDGYAGRLCEIPPTSLD